MNTYSFDKVLELVEEMSKKVILYHELDLERKINMAGKAQFYANQNHLMISMVYEYMKIL